MTRTILAAVAALVAVAPGASAQDKWPERQVTIIAPFTAGGTADMFARIFAQHMQQKYGTPFVVENRAGADGLRAVLVTAIATALPPFACGQAEVMLSKARSTWPPIRLFITSPELRYGTCVILVPVLI
jgi:tripartite-type tricarboxylate transporter receptor subunit TctC